MKDSPEDRKRTVPLPLEMDNNYLDGACLLFAMRANPSGFVGTWNQLDEPMKEVIRDMVKIAHTIFVELAQGIEEQKGE